MSENYVTREEVEVLLKEHSMKIKAEIESSIHADQKENSSEIIKKIDELKLEIKDTQKKTDERLNKLEKTDIERKTKQPPNKCNGMSLSEKSTLIIQLQLS